MVEVETSNLEKFSRGAISVIYTFIVLYIFLITYK